jgi:hypothetical protein
MIGCSKIGIVCRVALIDRFRYEEENEDDEDTIEAGADAVRPVPTKILNDVPC